MIVVGSLVINEARNGFLKTFMLKMLLMLLFYNLKMLCSRREGLLFRMNYGPFVAKVVYSSENLKLQNKLLLSHQATSSE